MAFDNAGVFLIPYMDAVSAAILGRVAGHIGIRQDLGHALGVAAVDNHQTDADAQFEAVIFPVELEFTHRLNQRFGHLPGIFKRAVFHKHRELIAAQAGDGVAFAHRALQHDADLAQQFVAGDVAAGVVDDLELVQVHVTQAVLRLRNPRRRNHPLHPAFEFTAVDQAGQGVVAGLITQLFAQLVIFRNILMDGDVVAYPARAVLDARYCVFCPVQAAVFAAVSEHAAPILAGCNRIPHVGMRFAVRDLAGQQPAQLRAEGLGGGIARYLGEFRIDVFDGAVFVGNNNARRAGLDRAF